MKKGWLTVAGVGVVGAVIWILTWGPGVPVPDPVTAPTDSVRKFMASKAFASLDEPAREAFVAKVRELPEERRREVFSREGLSEDEQRALRRNLRGTGRVRMVGDVKKFFELSPDEQVAQLDQRIDEMQTRRQAWEQRRTASPNTARPEGAERRRRQPSADRMQTWMERRLSEHPPLERAMFQEYFRRLRARRQQRSG